MTTPYPQQVVIVGFGLTGRACLEFFMQRGVTPRILDTRSQWSPLEQCPPQVAYHSGGLRLDWLLQAELVVISPGVALTTPELQQVLAAGIPIISEIELFCREVTQPIVAITGSNGKSTVTAWVGEMARQAGLKVGVGGNLGPAALTLLNQACDLYVIELSSFQLESTYTLQAAAATILNVTPDHQDRYPQGITAYQQAKQRIYRNATTCIINSDDPLTQPLTLATGAHCRTFGSTGEYHLCCHQGEIWLALANEPLLPVQRLKLLGQHNHYNALAALALAEAVGIPRSAALQALQTFTGLAHRYQLVWQQHGVNWINDSKATTVESTLAALQGSPTYRTLHWLLGGRSKGADFGALAPYFERDRVQPYCFGEAAAQLAALRPERAEQTATLEQAMQIIAQRVLPGDIVLLSPACASFDQFSSFEQRGQQFTQLARRLG
jgi:UDP-N-acetylmuramoylalanine--D-glutamate ligase